MRLDAHNPHVLTCETVRAHMDSCGARIGCVTYFKKDGTLRRLRYQRAAEASRILGTERGQRASATRARNHPHLMSVWDIGKHGWRTVNLETVISVRSNGKTRRYRDVTPLGGGRYALSPIFRLVVGTEESVS